MDQITATIQLKPKREKPVQNRHPWVFSGAIRHLEGDPGPGDLVTVVAHDNQWLATGYYNPHSQIRARLLSWEETDTLDESWWRARLAEALARREALALEPETTAYRLVHAESDRLPGLVVDRYGDYLVLQALTLGIDRRKEMIARLVAELLAPAGIVERSDVDVRAKEGLPQTSGVLWGAAPPEEIVVREHGHQFGAGLLSGHKTGLYLDQRENRALVAQPRFLAGRELLNVFAYSGGFAPYAAAAGAGPITNVDSSAPALAQAEENMARNGFDRPGDAYVVGDAFELLRTYRDEERRFDAIILDPPKFAHSRRDVKRATRGYKDLNWLAFRLLRPGGILATFSCSGLVDADLFQKVVFGAALDANRDAQILYQMGQAPDHPVLLTFPESAYLKGLLLRIL